MTHAKSRKLWQARVAEYEASGLTMRKWCERNGFRDGQLRYWLKKAREADQNQSWACVELVGEGVADAANPAVMSTGLNRTAACEPGLTVRVGAATIEVRSGFDSALLSEVLRVVTSTC